MVGLTESVQSAWLGQCFKHHPSAYPGTESYYGQSVQHVSQTALLPPDMEEGHRDHDTEAG